MTTDTRAAMTPADLEFLRGHARDYAGPGLDADRAGRYADWYLAQFAIPGASMDDMPAHPHVWGRFLAQDGHTVDVTPDGDGFLVTCRDGCGLGTSASQPDRASADKRADLHRSLTDRSCGCWSYTRLGRCIHTV